ncbi:HlyIII-domain-containing protein [Neoconidiobolus thromboides FSU 785]|nr:HlyIII-domain-containing protein [Neoconidiobolus thromboides FSU 785]
MEISTPDLQDITNMVEEVKPLLKKKFDQLLCNFQELPAWAQDNIYIHTGYRVPTESYKGCWKSLLYLHNETGNVYSHLLGAIAFLILGLITSYYLYSTGSAQWSDYFVIYAFIATAIFCLVSSALFHLFCCHSESHSKAWNKCDYIGIVFLIVGSFIPAVYFGFYCENDLKLIYLSSIIILGIATICVSMSDKLSEPGYRFHRLTLFMGLGLSGLIPLSHSIVRAGISHSFHSLSLNWMTLMGAMYITGALIYGFRIPERWYPGKFDFWGHSHQIWHLFVVAAAVFHYVGVLKAFHFHHSGTYTCQI